MKEKYEELDFEIMCININDVVSTSLNDNEGLYPGDGEDKDNDGY